MKDLFFELIRLSVGKGEGLHRTPTAEEWTAMYELAKKQSVLGVTFAAVKRLPKEMWPPRPLFLKWMGAVVATQERNKKLNKRCDELYAMLKADGKRACIMKGQGNALLYKVKATEGQDVIDLSTLRQCGDIDVWMDGSFDDVLRYVKSRAKVGEVDIHHAHAEFFDDAEVEVHFLPAILTNIPKNRKLKKFFEAETDRCFANEVCLDNESEAKVAVSTIEFNMVHQLVHIYHHLLTEGVGLRQLMDYYFVVKALRASHKDEASITELVLTIDGLGLRRFAKVVMWILGDVFGLEREEMLWEPNAKDGRFLLDAVIESGNFGHWSDDFILQKPKLLRPFYKSRRNVHYARFGAWEWFWVPVSSLYWNIWKLRIKD